MKGFNQKMIKHIARTAVSSEQRKAAISLRKYHGLFRERDEDKTKGPDGRTQHDNYNDLCDMVHIIEPTRPLPFQFGYDKSDLPMNFHISAYDFRYYVSLLYHINYIRNNIERLLDTACCTKSKYQDKVAPQLLGIKVFKVGKKLEDPHRDTARTHILTQLNMIEKDLAREIHSKLDSTYNHAWVVDKIKEANKPDPGTFNHYRDTMERYRIQGDKTGRTFELQEMERRLPESQRGIRI